MHLGGSCLDQLLPTVACVDTPKPGHAIENLVALGIENVNAVCARNDARLFLVQILVIGKRMQMMRPVEFLPICRAPLFHGCHVNLLQSAYTLNIRISRSQGVMIS